jgi:RNA polymerase sigma factor (sigma-70 family)
MAEMRNTLCSVLERLFREHNLQLFTSALGVTGCPERAEDAVQEAFYRLFRRQDRPRHIKAYVFRSVRNAALDQLERNRPERPIERDEAIFDWREGPDETAVMNEFRRDVAQAMKTLSEDERETVISHIYADLSFREIAKIRETSTNTIWSWYRRAMAKLRRQLGKRL